MMVTEAAKAAFKCYLVQVAWLKLFLGAFGWQLAASCLDDSYKLTTVGRYIFRGVIVGMFDAAFCCLGCLIGIFIYEVTFKDADYVDTFKLWIAAFVVGFFWQMETDFAVGLAGEGWGYVNDNYSALSIILNFVVYFIAHTALFHFSCEVIKADWREWIIDFQVGFGGFGFYIAGALEEDGTIDPKDVFWVALNAGFWTAVFGSLPGILAIAWACRGQPDQVPILNEDGKEDGGTFQTNSDKTIE